MLDSDRSIDPLDVPSWARERAVMLQGMYVHVVVFVLVNGGLGVINWLTRGEDGSWWVVWLLMAWGLALLIHVATIVIPVFSPRWVERRAREIATRGR